MSARHRLASTAVAVTAITAASSAPALAINASDLGPTSRGPSTVTDPYVIPRDAAVKTRSILTVDDAGSARNGYELAGLPDGLGAFSGGRRQLDVFMNHEIKPDAGTVRRHGQRGSFVSSLSLDTRRLGVSVGSDLIDPGVAYWNYPEQKYQASASPAGDNPRQFGAEAPASTLDDFAAQLDPFTRLCSSSVTRARQLYNRATGRGYKGHLYFANEEGGDEGRTFGVLENGTAKQLPRLGLASLENTNAAYNETDSTLTIGSEDGGSGQLWAHVGHKQRSGDAFDRAGLTNGNSHVIDLTDESVGDDAGFRARYGKGKAASFDLAEVDWDQSGAAQNAEAAADGLALNRIEDGVWDPENPNVYYFNTTEGGDKTPHADSGASRDGGGLWKLEFEDIEHPELGGSLTLLLDGSEAIQLNKPDNLTIDGGQLLIQEDPGDNAHVARIVAYRLDTGELKTLAGFDEQRFKPGAPSLLTQDEESSGIVSVSDELGSGWYLFDAQVHLANPNPEYVEYGQFLAMHVDWKRFWRSAS